MNISETEKQLYDAATSIFTDYDDDKDGHINFAEFKKYQSEENTDMKSGDMKAVFDIIDENKDGEINKDEFINYLRKLISDEEE